MNLEELLAKQKKSRREFIAPRPHHLVEYDGENFIICADDTCKQKYSIHINEDTIFIREDLYALKSPIIEFEAYKVHSLNKKLIEDAKAAGTHNKSMNNQFKKDAVEQAKNETIAKFGEKEYFEVLGEERVKKVKEEKSEVKKTIKATKKAAKGEMPEVAANIDDVLVKQVNESMKINEEFKANEEILNSEFDKDVIAIPDVEVKVEEIGGLEPEVMPCDLSLTEDEKIETSIIDEDFNMDEFLDSNDIF